MEDSSCNTTEHDRLDSCGSELHMSFQITITLLSAVFLLVGVTGNSLVMTALCLVPRLRTFSNAFIVNLAVADLGALFTGMTTLLLGLYGAEILLGNPWICQLLLHFTCHFIFTSITTLQIIAVDRYLIITKLRPVYCLYYRGWRIWALVGGTWLVGLVMTEFSLFSTFVCKDGYMGSLHICYIDVSNPLSMACLTTALFLSCFLCMFTIPFFYALIFRKIRTTRQRIKRFTAQSPTAEQNDATGASINTFSKAELAVTKMLAVVYFTYVICWTPMLLTHLTYFGNGCPSYVAHYTFSLLALINSSLNPLIYTGVNKSFRHSISDLLKQKPPSESTNTPMAMNFTSVTAGRLE